MRLVRIIAMVAPLVLSACSVFGVRSGTEEPRYMVIDHVAAAEIREYGPRLAAFIFGANRGGGTIPMTAPVGQSEASRTIAMTAPVAQSGDGAGRWTIRFFMPASYTAQTLPLPTDPEIRIVTVPAETYGVIRFTGSRTPARVAVEQARLLDLLKASRWRVEGAPTAWFFDPPWTLPFLRRNEVAVRVEPQP